MFRVPVYTVLLSASALALGTLYGDPSLLLRATHEDGVVEWLSVLALAALAAMIGRRMLAPPPAMPKPYRLAAWGLVALALASVGEELSWGQRVFGFRTGETMARVNLQHETNLHNLIPGELFNGIIVFTLGIGFVVIPTVWRRRSDHPPAWIPSAEVSLMMLDAILINHYRVRSLPEKIGLAVLLLLLAAQTVSAVRGRNWPLIWGCAAGWITAICLYHCRAILRAANHQYEIRELLIVILATVWADQTLDAYQRQSQPPTSPQKARRKREGTGRGR